MLLTLFLNEMEVGMSNEEVAFAYDTKLFILAKTKCDGKELQKDPSIVG